jgi:hypothetical protein
LRTKPASYEAENLTLKINQPPKIREKTQKGKNLSKKYLTAKECVIRFNDELGVKISEAAFSKHKKAGIFKVHREEGSKRDLFEWDSTAEAYFLNVGLRNIKTREAYERFKALKQERDETAALNERAQKAWGKIIKAKTLKVEDMPSEAVEVCGVEYVEKILYEAEIENRLLRDVAIDIYEALEGNGVRYVEAEAPLLEAIAKNVRTVEFMREVVEDEAIEKEEETLNAIGSLL